MEWTVYGKIRSIGRTDGTTIGYAYGPSGNRASKTVNGVTTWYVRDAQGNTMGLYDNRNGANNWREQHLYGSSRLGTWDPGIDLGSTNGTAAWDTIGKKNYELTNHLGNVMATITDKRLQHSSDGTAIDYFDADVQTAQEYYAFGSIIPGRTYSAGKGYRYGFNGKENDNEVKKDGYGNPNVGSQQDYGMRINDTRLGRFLSVDPLSKSYPWYTPYQFAGNSPISNIDLDGLEEVSYLEAIKRSMLGQPLIKKQSEWLQQDRFTANGTFAKAAEYNTSKGNSGVYNPINQIHNYYQWADGEIQKNKINIKWFQAAEDVTSPLFGIGASQYGLGRIGGKFSTDASDFLANGNKFLFEKNIGMMKTVLDTKDFKGLSGKGADYAMVEAEQTALTGFIKTYENKVGAKKFNAIIGNVNNALNNPYIELDYIKDAKTAIGGNIDFRNQKHREALGKALVDQIRGGEKK